MKKLLIITCSIFICITSHAQTEIWGMTRQGGDGFGTIFKTDSNGNNQEVLETFRPNVPGNKPFDGQLCEVSNDVFYGMTSEGGLYGSGVIFQYDYATNMYVRKIDFSNSNGRRPLGSLIMASNGKLYGVTSEGGASNRGVIFEYDHSSNTYTKKIDLVNYNVANPFCTLLQASNGMLYGTSIRGGTNNLGVIFEYDYSTNTFTKKIDFDSINGSFPGGSLMQASNGKLYGMTQGGGANNWGVIFEYDYTSNTYTKKIDLSFINGRTPGGDLIQASNGKLYGMTAGGGATNDGVIFEYDYSSNTYVKKIDLTQANGQHPHGSFIQVSNGKLYGMTNSGGTTEIVGVIFEYDYTTNTYIKKMEFNGANGSSPSGTFILASNGKLLGTTGFGGAANQGVIFEYDYSTNAYAKKIDLGTAIKGSFPDGSLMQASNGKLYGMTSEGGSNEAGVIFEYDYSSNIYTKKIDFNSLNGSHPFGSLIQASNSKLYGMTPEGGTNNNAGVLFEYDYSTNTYTKKIDFTQANGHSPNGSLMQASNGKLYGMTSGGGAYFAGVIFEYDYSSNTYTKKIDLVSSPTTSLVQASNGKLYGMTYENESSAGVIFEYDYSSNTYTQKINFGGVNGVDPVGALMQASNGKLYGMTSRGGANNAGVIFEYDHSSNIYTKKIDFSLVNGITPWGSLMQASNGKLYGMTYAGGTNGTGVIFEYDYSSNTYVKKLDFNGANGRNPTANNLIEIGSTISTTSVNVNNCAGGSISVHYTITGTYNAGNVFTAQLSDASGSFTLPVNIGSISSTEAGSINALIPSNTVPGGGYRIRVVSSDPVITGSNNGSNITINPLPNATTDLNGITITANQNGAAYQWVDCNNGYSIISGATHQSYTPAINGQYAVVIVMNMCTDTSACVTINTVGIDKLANNNDQLKIYPNPGKGILTIQSTTEGVYSLINELGQTIQLFELNTANNYSISIENLDNGIYFIVGKDNDQMIRQKVMMIK